MINIFCSLVLCFFLYVITLGNKNQINALFQESNELYRNGKYYEAIDKYKNIIETGYEHAYLYYNLANAYYRINDFPRSIYYYEKALKLKPRFKDAKFNLQLAKATILPDIQEVPEPFYTKIINNFSSLFDIKEWTILSITIAFITAMLISIFLILQTHRLKMFLFYSSILFLIMLVFSLLLGYVRYNQTVKPNYAIIMQSSATIKSSPDQHSTDIYIAPAGLKVKILSTLSDWYEIKLPDGNKGWMNKDALEII